MLGRLIVDLDVPGDVAPGETDAIEALVLAFYERRRAESPLWNGPVCEGCLAELARPGSQFCGEGCERYASGR